EGMADFHSYSQTRAKPTGCAPWGCESPHHNLRPDPLPGEDLQQQRVAEPAVDHVDLADARAEAVEAGLDLGDHAGVDDAVADQLSAARGAQAGLEAGRVLAVEEDAGRVGQEDELFGSQMGGAGGGGGGGVD